MRHFLLRALLDAQSALAAEAVGDVVHDVPGVSLVSVQAQVGECHLEVVVIIISGGIRTHRARLLVQGVSPENLVKANQAAVKGVRTVVLK